MSPQGPFLGSFWTTLLSHCDENVSDDLSFLFLFFQSVKNDPSNKVLQTGFWGDVQVAVFTATWGFGFTVWGVSVILSHTVNMTPSSPFPHTVVISPSSPVWSRLPALPLLPPWAHIVYSLPLKSPRLVSPLGRITPLCAFWHWSRSDR